MDELPDEIFDRVTDLSEEGNLAMERGSFTEAIALWRDALKLLPSPQLQWAAAMWLHGSIGDAQRELGDIQGGLSSFQSAAAADGGAHNAFVQYGLGASLFDLGRYEEATDPLLRAYMLAGTDVFEEGSSDYLQHLVDKRLVK